MDSDMVVAMKEASANGTTLFGLNHHAVPEQRHLIQRFFGEIHDRGATLQTSSAKLPQVRQTYSVLGLQPQGAWGLLHGINEHRVVIGVTHWTSRLPNESEAPSGTDLVRLALERSHSALHAVEVLTDLIGRHGQGAGQEDLRPRLDHIFLIADRTESFVVEACGRHWALLECRDTRVVTNAAMIRQDWSRLAPGLADFVIRKGWWADDGSKIDFVRCLGENTKEAKTAQKRWGRASLALAQQHGAIDPFFLRRMLAEHYENNVELQHHLEQTRLASGFVVDLQRDEQPIVAWFAFGTPLVSLYFPICLLGELPAAWGAEHSEPSTLEQHVRELEKLANENEADHHNLTQALERLQTRFDQDAEEFLLKAQASKNQGNALLLAQLATQMMYDHVESFEKEFRRLFHIEEKTPQPAGVNEEVFFA